MDCAFCIVVRPVRLHYFMIHVLDIYMILAFDNGLCPAIYEMAISLACALPINMYFSSVNAVHCMLRFLLIGCVCYCLDGMVWHYLTCCVLVICCVFIDRLRLLLFGWLGLLALRSICMARPYGPAY